MGIDDTGKNIGQIWSDGANTLCGSPSLISVRNFNSMKYHHYLGVLIDMTDPFICTTCSHSYHCRMHGCEALWHFL